ncbi:MAG TPA: PfkB family carbohydrate kinase [Candidatus Saccharimonadales bacterium]|nr:PfkB family carbohydrate kinase [Candidatus Saccharimonadales bacterium]
MDTPRLVALGSCYVDYNIGDFPARTAAQEESELIGGAYENVAGGSAVNFCRLAGRLGIAPSFVGVTGKDVMAQTLRLLLERDGVEVHIAQIEGEQTNVGWNVTETGGIHRMDIIGTANAAMRPETVMPALQSALNGADYLYLGGVFKLKGLLPAYDDIAAMAHEQGVQVVVDHGRLPAETSEETRQTVRRLVSAADYYFPSKNEFLAVWDFQSIEQGIRQLQQQAPDLTVIVKNGADGAVFMQDGEVAAVRPPRIVQGGDVTGAGDSFNAGVIAAHAAGRELPESVAFGCAVAVAKISGQPLPQL